MAQLLDTALQWLAGASAIALSFSGASLVLGMFRPTRKIAGIGLVVSSLVFGITLWANSAVVTFAQWNWIGLVIGLVLFGVGVVPMSFLASGLSAQWSTFAFLAWLLVLTFGTRALGRYCLSERWQG